MKKDVIIRNADYQDYSSLCDMFARANKEHCAMRPDLYREVEIAIPKSKYRLALLARDLFGIQPVSLKIAELDGQNIGAVFVQSLARSKLSWSAFEKEAYLDNIVVVPNMRRQGIGSLLLNSAEEWAKETGHTHMWGKIISKNDASTNFFKKAAFHADSFNVGRHLV